MRAHDKLADILAAGAVPIVFGGDHCVTIPVLQVLAGKLAGRLGIVAFDARLDLGFAPRYEAGSQWARVFELGIVEPANFVEIGIRDASATPADRLVADELGIRSFTVAEIDELGIVAVAQEALEAAATGTEALYVSIDLDVVDPCEGGARAVRHRRHECPRARCVPSALWPGDASQGWTSAASRLAATLRAAWPRLPRGRRSRCSRVSPPSAPDVRARRAFHRNEARLDGRSIEGPPRSPDVCRGAGEERGGPMTRKERELVVEDLLAHYDDVGATVVGDDQSLCRLLTVMHRASAGNEVGMYVSSYIGA